MDNKPSLLKCQSTSPRQRYYLRNLLKFDFHKHIWATKFTSVYKPGSFLVIFKSNIFFFQKHLSFSFGIIERSCHQKVFHKMLVLALEAIVKYLLRGLISSKVPDCKHVTLIKSNSFPDIFQRSWAKTFSLILCRTGVLKNTISDCFSLKL